MNKKETGKLGETQAVELLKSKGYKILDVNWKCNMGEIDIVARKEYTLIFIEVKTRRTLVYGTPAESVNTQKKRHIKNAAVAYMKSHKMTNMLIRFDVVEILINHIESAF